MNIQKNQIFTVKITDMGTDGEGIGHLEDSDALSGNGYTLFVKDAVLGDTVLAKVVKPKKGYAFARLEEVLEPSSDRVEPVCAYARQCGGCQLQAVSYEKQLAFKDRKVKNNLIRIGGFAPDFVEEIMEAPVGMEHPFHYRNKAQFPVGMDKNGRLIAGFYAGRTHTIIENRDCALGVAENKIVLDIVLDFCMEKKIPAYDETTGKGLLRHVLIRTGHVTGQIMVVLVLASPILPSKNNFVKALLKLHPEITTVVINVNNRNTSMVLGDKEHVIYGKGYIEDELCGKRFRISPRSFYQVNPVQTEILYGKALEYAGLTGKETVVDAYCGTGTIGMIASDKAGKVIGVELNADAVRDARNNAKANQIRNIQFYQNDAGKFLVEMAGQGAKVDVVLMDPPRSGSTEEFMSSVVQIGPERIVYVSCNPETLVRDLKYFKKKGYRVAKGVGVDMFPFTEHVESVVLMQYCGK